MSNGTEPDDDKASSADLVTETRDVPWRDVTLSDLGEVGFEDPVTGTEAAECSELSGLFQAAASSDADARERPGCPERRVFSLLAAVLSMYFKPVERNEPCGLTVT